MSIELSLVLQGKVTNTVMFEYWEMTEMFWPRKDEMTRGWLLVALYFKCDDVNESEWS